MLFAALALTLSPVQAPAPPARPCAAPVHRQFDFWIGTWDVVSHAGTFAGVNRIEPADGRCVLAESWSSAGGGYTGHSLSSVGSDGRWRQTLGRLERAAARARGRPRRREDGARGRNPGNEAGAPPVRNRITWSPELEGRVRQHWETSSDGGKTYTTAFDGMYHPVKAGASAQAGLFGKLAGGWIGSGAVLKREAHVELTVTPMLGGRFVQLHWVNLGGRDGREPFEGLAIYDEGPAGTSTATWWDSQGARHAVTATTSGPALTALWGDRGRTVYRLLETGELEVVDSVKKADGSWAEFGRSTLRRKGPGR
jgi:hypothetical protein